MASTARKQMRRGLRNEQPSLLGVGAKACALPVGES